MIRDDDPNVQVLTRAEWSALARVPSEVDNALLALDLDANTELDTTFGWRVTLRKSEALAADVGHSLIRIDYAMRLTEAIVDILSNDESAHAARKEDYVRLTLRPTATEIVEVSLGSLTATLRRWIADHPEVRKYLLKAAISPSVLSVIVGGVIDGGKIKVQVEINPPSVSAPATIEVPSGEINQSVSDMTSLGRLTDGRLIVCTPSPVPAATAAHIARS